MLTPFNGELSETSLINIKDWMIRFYDSENWMFFLRKCRFLKIWLFSDWSDFVLKIEHHQMSYRATFTLKMIFVHYFLKFLIIFFIFETKMLKKFTKIIKNKQNEIIEEISWEWCNEKLWRHRSIFRNHFF